MRTILLLVLLVAATPLAAQVTFKVRIELVRIDVLVERNGKPVQVSPRRIS